jgi:ketosteroid isomerase-like protein
MRSIRSLFLAFSLFGAVAATAPAAQAQAADSASAHAAATGFLDAFDSLQWDTFRGYFADEVTMFFPFPDTPARADGRQAVEARFRTFFDGALAGWQRSGRTGAPRMGITPRDLRVQMAASVAVVSFHLGAETPSRRSLVFRHTPADGWKLIHWHASPPPQRPAPAAAPAPTTPSPRD